MGEDLEIVGFRDTQKTVCTGVEMFKKQLDEGLGGDNAGLLLRGTAKEDVERGMVLAKPGSITPHTQFKGEVLRAVEGRGWTSYSVLQRLSSAVLLPDDGCDRIGEAAGGHGDGDAELGDNIALDVTLHTPVAMEKRAYASLSVRAAGPSAQVPSQRSLSSSTKLGPLRRMLRRPPQPVL